MQRQRQRPRHREPAPIPVAAEPGQPEGAIAQARATAARREAEAADPGSIHVTVRTTASRTSGVVQLVATPDTPVADILERACDDLGIEDRRRYTLVANGEVLGDSSRPLGEITREHIDGQVRMRLVRRPEAGALARAG